MKTEHRHYLETNDLAARLATWAEKVKPYSKAILWGGGALLGLYLVGSWWSARQAQQDREFWDVYQTTLNETNYSGVGSDFAQFQQIAQDDQYGSAEGRQWAWMAWADRQVRIAAETYLVNRDDALERLKAPQATYDKLARSSSARILRDRAAFGLGRVYELQGDAKAAKQQYSRVGGLLQVAAENRLQQLESPETEQAISWLATAELPKPEQVSGGGVPGVRPEFGAEIPTADSQEDDYDPNSPVSDLLKNLKENQESAASEQPRYAEGENEDTSDETSPEDAAAEAKSDAAAEQTQEAKESAAAEQ